MLPDPATQPIVLLPTGVPGAGALVSCPAFFRASALHLPWAGAGIGKKMKWLFLFHFLHFLGKHPSPCIGSGRIMSQPREGGGGASFCNFPAGQSNANRRPRGVDVVCSL